MEIGDRLSRFWHGFESQKFSVKRITSNSSSLSKLMTENTQLKQFKGVQVLNQKKILGLECHPLSEKQTLYYLRSLRSQFR